MDIDEDEASLPLADVELELYKIRQCLGDIADSLDTLVAILERKL